jgi:hypothetical protein
MHRRSGAVHFRRVLMYLTGAVTCEDGCLLVSGRRASMCRTGVKVSYRGISMGPSGPFQRLEGVQPRALRAVGTRRQTRSQLGSA